MADTKISGLGALTAVAQDDELVIVDKSDTTMADSGTTKKITKANLVPQITPASSSAPASLDLHEDTDNGTNKITVTAPSAIASNKTITLPDATDTLVGKATTDTLTNKTLTSPVLSDTVPTADGALGFDRTNEDLVVGDGSAGQLVHMGAWKSWTPTWTNLTVGNATVEAKYTKIGKTVHFKLRITLGSTSSVGTSPSFTLPLTAVFTGSTPEYIGDCRIRDLAPANFEGKLLISSTTVAQPVCYTVSGANVAVTGISSTAPMTWATGDYFSCNGIYEAA